MISGERDRMLIGLAKIETRLSRVYEKLSGKPAGVKADIRKRKMVLIDYARGIK